MVDSCARLFGVQTITIIQDHHPPRPLGSLGFRLSPSWPLVPLPHVSSMVITIGVLLTDEVANVATIDFAYCVQHASVTVFFECCIALNNHHSAMYESGDAMREREVEGVDSD